jgi:hypothetical protein
MTSSRRHWIAGSTPVGSTRSWAWYEVQMRILDMTITEIDAGRDIAVSTLSGGSR